MTDIIARLKNWGVWARSYPARIRCFSLESSYRNRSGQWDWEIPPQDIRKPVDEPDAIVVWSAIRTIETPYQAALKWSYVYPWIDRWIAARKAKFYKPTKLEDATKHAEYLVQYILY